MHARTIAVLAATGAVAAWLSPAVAQTSVVTNTDAADPIAGAITIRQSPASVLGGGWPGKRQLEQLPGFPITIGTHQNFAPWRSPVLADLDADGDLEIIQSSTEGKLYAWHHDTTPVAGFPITTTGFPQYPASVADMDGDGDVEIVLNTRGPATGGRLYAFDHTGAALPGFPLNFNNQNVVASPALYDLDGDGQLEIISTVRDYPIGYVHVVEMDGTLWSGNWPVTLSHVPTGTPAVADVDADGEPEIFCMSYDQMYLLGTDGTPEAGWPRGISGANFSYQSAALADLDGNGDLEIALAAHQSSAGAYVFHHDGSLASGWPFLFDTWSYCPPTITDLEGDGALEVIAGQAGTGAPSDCFWVWEADGDTRPGFPYMQTTHGGGSEGPLTVADVDGDGVMEIFADHNIMESDLGYLFGVDASGNDLPGFPLRPQGFTYQNSATIADVDGNGTYELGVTSFTAYNVWVNMYTFPTPSTATGREWPTYHANYRRDGLYAPMVACYADFNGDGAVDTRDVLAFLNEWAGGAGSADCDGNSLVDTRDVLCFLNAWNEGCP